MPHPGNRVKQVEREQKAKAENAGKPKKQTPRTPEEEVEYLAKQKVKTAEANAKARAANRKKNERAKFSKNFLTNVGSMGIDFAKKGTFGRAKKSKTKKLTN
jgi:hypothetical protein